MFKYFASICKYVCQNWSFKSKIQYEINFVWQWQFESLTLHICKSKPCLKHTTINNYHWFTDPTFWIQCIGIFQRWWTNVNLSIPECNYIVLPVTSRGCLKLYLNSWELILTCSFLSLSRASQCSYYMPRGWGYTINYIYKYPNHISVLLVVTSLWFIRVTLGSSGQAKERTG